MKIQGIVLLAILATSVFVGGKISSGADKESMQNYDEQITQIEDLWKSGKPHEYYTRAAEITANIISNIPTSNLNTPAARLFGNLISKEPNVFEIGVQDLSVTKHLALYLLLGHKASAEERRTNILLLSMYLGKIRNEIIPNYERKLELPNVAPPLGTPGAVGMSPEEIKDPVARAKYEAAIRENQENSLMNSRQAYYLRKTDRTMSKHIMKCMIKTFRGTDASVELLNRCMAEAKFTDSEQKEVMAGLSERGPIAAVNPGSRIPGAGLSGISSQVQSAAVRLDDSKLDSNAPSVEGAVTNALKWLKKQQLLDGSWPPKTSLYNEGMTGLALLAFLAHGETSDSTSYGTVPRGLRWLVKIQKPSGYFSKDVYAHAIDTYAVSEGYALTKMKILRKSMDRAVSVIIAGQQTNGAWTYGYQHNGRRDISVMCWQIQALTAASLAGCKVPGLKGAMKKAISAVKFQYLELNEDQSPASSGKDGTLEDKIGMFAYEAWNNDIIYAGKGKIPANISTPTMTAVGTLSLQLLGEGKSPEAKGGLAYFRHSGCEWNKPHKVRPIYHWYYVTQVIFQGQFVNDNVRGREEWNRWNKMLVKTLIDNQNKDGSWQSPMKQEDGRLRLPNTGSVWSTALGVLTLMVYDRILLTYQEPK